MITRYHPESLGRSKPNGSKFDKVDAAVLRVDATGGRVETAGANVGKAGNIFLRCF